MTVSVVIPAIPPRARMLPRAIASVAAQTRQPDEVVISIDREGIGAAANRNRALAQVSSEWVAFLDDDDEFLPHHLDSLLAYADEHGADFVYPWFEGINCEGMFKAPIEGSTVADVEAGAVPTTTPEGRTWDKTMEAWLRRAGNFIPVTVLVRTDLVRQVGGFVPISEDPMVDQGDDYSCWLRLLDAGARFAHCPHRTWRWIGHSGHTSGRRWTQLAEPSLSFAGFAR